MSGTKLCVVLLCLLLIAGVAWAGDHESQVPFVVSHVDVPRADATAIVVREQGARTELLIQHSDGSVDSVDVTKPWSPKLEERVSWASAVHASSVTFVGQSGLAMVCDGCRNSAESDGNLALLDSADNNGRVLLRFEHVRDQKLNGDFLYVLTSSGLSIIRVRPEVDPVAIASLYGG